MRVLTATRACACADARVGRWVDEWYSTRVRDTSAPAASRMACFLHRSLDCSKMCLKIKRNCSLFVVWYVPAHTSVCEWVGGRIVDECSSARACERSVPPAATVKTECFVPSITQRAPRFGCKPSACSAVEREALSSDSTRWLNEVWAG